VVIIFFFLPCWLVGFRILTGRKTENKHTTALFVFLRPPLCTW